MVRFILYRDLYYYIEIFCLWLISPLLLLDLLNVLGNNTPGHKIADFVSLPCISFISAFRTWNVL